MNYFEEIKSIVFKKNALQRKRIEKFTDCQHERYHEFCEKLSENLLTKLLTTDVEREFACDSYLKMCRDFLHAQIRFKQTGEYPILLASDAKKEVYDNPDVMRYYMSGLLLSYMFWPNHYKLFEFFQDCISNENFKPKNYLEIGVGHGLFTNEMLKMFPAIKPTVVDISQTSIQAADKLLKTFNADISKIDFIHRDFFELEESDQKYDFIIMGEVLEHVNDGYGFMQKAKNLLNSDGKVFMTTAANSPALDHVLHFHNEHEIRSLLKECGFNIELEIVMAAEDLPQSEWEKELVTINYGCLLSNA